MIPIPLSSPSCLLTEGSNFTSLAPLKSYRENLQRDLSALQHWSQDWLLMFHPEKCKAMHIGKSKSINYEYHMGPEEDPVLSSTSAEKDIGVVIDDDLAFDKHIAEKVNKANKIMGLIRKTFEYLDAEMLCLLFRSLVRSHIEYANPV